MIKSVLAFKKSVIMRQVSHILKTNMIVYFSQKTPPSVYTPKPPFAVLHDSTVSTPT